MPDNPSKPRYKTVFTPVGWHVIDTLIARDPVGQFGLGGEEYGRAKAFACELNRMPETAVETRPS